MLPLFPAFSGISGPLVLVVMDGVGVASDGAGNAVAAARKPTLDWLRENCPNLLLRAHGKAVGMPSDEDMGNSEVGHNALGAGQVYAQGAALVEEAIKTGAIWRGGAWREVMARAASAAATLHLIGLLSDGNVHSHFSHVKAMLLRAREEGVRRVRVHVLLDGRDVPETSALEYLLPFEAFLAELSDARFDARIASGGGRQIITMDRYEADWAMVERGWRTHVSGEGEQFSRASEAVMALRARQPGLADQNMPPFVIAENGVPVGRVKDGDAVVLFNFRGDRALEISRAFTETRFSAFARGSLPDVVYAGMLQYDGDLKIPERFLVSPPAIRNTLGEWLSASGVSQFACSETQKFGHVTYFWNGNRSAKFAGEVWREIPSDRVSFEERPWMKSAEIADAMIEAIQSGAYRFLRCNFANGDMVGHTGNFVAARLAVEALDLALSRLLPAIQAARGAALITADHGNAEEMFELEKKSRQPILDAEGRPKAKTSHTLNPVPLFFYAPGYARQWTWNGDISHPGLAHLAATVSNVLGFAKHPDWAESLLCYRAD
ncbi:MAG: 2,3-bisphosphoglycerate-independent phosphoglycerate mutase [Zoogloeaceae bacterium]|jgi:2,3-bisphosphoglycerate-independent phosphoglycerate mutase|nr:2,3-bisphosphoglycerate-independent phosphoglycerate mutase [Zoogloeaceae bacterium]